MTLEQSDAVKHDSIKSKEGTETSEQTEHFPWYTRVSEDWWATLLGLMLVILIVSRLITAIP